MAFIYNRPVTGKDFIGRKSELSILSNLLSQMENVYLYGAPKTGKSSLIRQVFFNMRISSQNFVTVENSSLNVRTVADYMLRLGSEIIKTAGASSADYAGLVSKYLDGSHFVFDNAVYNSKGLAISLNWDIDDEDIRKIFELPYRIALDKGQKYYIILKDFQNVMQTEDGDKICNILNTIFKDTDRTTARACYVFSGSCVNAMKDIFEERKLFYRQVNKLEMEQIQEKDLLEASIHQFLSGGKVIDRELLAGVCSLFKNHPWYINHFCAICDAASKGYVIESMLTESLEDLVAIHSPRFESIMNDLTTFQICLLRAIIDGYSKFSSSEVISKYNLNSSANVRRLKDALCKKEIVTFDEHDTPEILDPLFEYWVKKYFFEIRGE